jgi:hypothetical protein
MANVRPLWELLWQLAVIAMAAQTAELEDKVAEMEDTAKTMLIIMFIGIFGEIGYQIFSIVITFYGLLRPKEILAQIVVDTYDSMLDAEIDMDLPSLPEMPEGATGDAGGAKEDAGGDEGEEGEEEEESDHAAAAGQTDDEMTGALEEWAAGELSEEEEEEEDDVADEDPDYQVIAPVVYRTGEDDGGAAPAGTLEAGAVLTPLSRRERGDGSWAVEFELDGATFWATPAAGHEAILMQAALFQ